MTDFWVAPSQLFDGQALHAGCLVRIVDNQVVDVATNPKQVTGALPIKGCLSPGFVDLQVNGGGGVLLNATPTRKGMATIAAAHRHFGTVALMPTVITDSPKVLEHAVAATLASLHDPSILGLHIEGPHISTARRGTHEAKYIRDLDAHTMDLVAHLRQHKVCVLLTLAPEAASPEQIQTLTDMGTIVAIGHTDATAEDVATAIAAGASCATHLFNAMSPMMGRSPGAVGAVINSQLNAGVICDGHHVDDRMIALAVRARPARDLMFLVSDAMPTVGGPTEFDLYGQKIRLHDGRLINSDGNLAGAHVTQAQGVARLVHNVGLSLQDALRMAITTPARIVGQDHLARIISRDTRDLVVMSDDLRTTVCLDDILAQARTRRSND